jgi:23S rRNA (guanosine2251-2'-O)-methyltransferase
VSDYLLSLRTYDRFCGVLIQEINIQILHEKMFRKLSTDQLNRLTIYQYKTTVKNPVSIILDNVRSMNNVGSIFRTADGFGVEKLYLCGITACPPHRDIHKTALGAENSMPWEYRKNSVEICKELKLSGYILIAIEQAEGSISPQEFKSVTDKKIALIMGNETEGVSQEVLDICDHCIEVPQFGTKHSFNVSVCAGIVLWELLGRRSETSI